MCIRSLVLESVRGWNLIVVIHRDPGQWSPGFSAIPEDAFSRNWDGYDKVVNELAENDPVASIFLFQCLVVHLVAGAATDND